MKRLATAAALVGVLGVAAGQAGASVVLTGCSGGSFGADCGLDELIAGGSVSVNETLFANWSLSLFDGRPLDASAIRVDPIDNLHNPGFTLTDTARTLRAADGDFSLNDLVFTVSVTGGPLRIYGNSLAVRFGSMSNPGAFTYADAAENVFDAGASLLSNLDLFCQTAACANGGSFDAASFPLQTDLLVFAGINIASESVGDAAQIDSITMRFAQIPEPGILALLGLGIGGMVVRRRPRS